MGSAVQVAFLDAMPRMRCSAQTELALKTLLDHLTYKRVEELVHTDASTSFEQRNIQACGFGRPCRSAGW